MNVWKNIFKSTRIGRRTKCVLNVSTYEIMQGFINFSNHVNVVQFIRVNIILLSLVI